LQHIANLCTLVVPCSEKKEGPIRKNWPQMRFHDEVTMGYGVCQLLIMNGIQHVRTHIYVTNKMSTLDESTPFTAVQNWEGTIKKI